MKKSTLLMAVIILVINNLFAGIDLKVSHLSFVKNSMGTLVTMTVQNSGDENYNGDLAIKVGEIRNNVEKYTILGFTDLIPAGGTKDFGLGYRPGIFSIDLNIYNSEVEDNKDNNLFYYNTATSQINLTRDNKSLAYLNPMTNILNINCLEQAVVKIFGLNGVELYSSSIKNDESLTVDTSDWSKGVYLVQIIPKTSHKSVVKIIK